MNSWNVKIWVPIIIEKSLTFLLKWSKGVEHTHSLMFRSVFQSRATDPNSAASCSTLIISVALLLSLVESPGNPAINIYFIQLISIMIAHLVVWSVVTWRMTNGECQIMRRTRHALCMGKLRIISKFWFKNLKESVQLTQYTALKLWQITWTRVTGYSLEF